jgi:hypothetical protein
MGILPNQFRLLLNNEMGECDSALLELRKTFFWDNYRIWKKRKSLISQYWNNPQLKNKSGRKNTSDITMCKNPFHFLKKVTDISKQRLTRCPCSKVKFKKTFFPDIRALLDYDSVPIINVNDGLDRKHFDINMSRTFSDIILEDHDRKKKRKR